MNIKAENSRCGIQRWDSELSLFADVAVYPNRWLSTARDHLYAAQVLLPHVERRHAVIEEMMKNMESGSLEPSLNSNYFLMCALAIENLFKSVIAILYKDEVRAEIMATSKIPKILLGHDLVDLAGRAEYELNIDSEYILMFLTRYGIWSGKYPLPISNDDKSMTDKLSDGDFYMMGGYDPKTVPSYLSFGAELLSWATVVVNKALD